MDPFDLNINNYSIDELEDFFMLGANAGVPIYDTATVEQKKNALCNKLTRDSAFAPELRSGIRSFLEEASGRIVTYISGSGSGSGSGGSTNIRLDYNPYNPSQSEFMPSMQQSQAASNTFISMRNNVIQEGGHFLIQNPSAMNQHRAAGTGTSTPISASALAPVPTPAPAPTPPLSLHPGSTAFQGAGTGTINPIQRRTVKRALNIDTRFRPNYHSTKSTDIQISLPYRFEKVIGMRVAAVEMPLTYYAISAELGNNSFRVDWLEPGDTTPRQYCITLPDGNYETAFTSTSDTRNTTIESAINELLTAGPPGNAPLKLRYTVDRTSGRSIFAQDNSSISAIPFKVSFNVDRDGEEVDNAALPMYLGWSLGFRATTYNRGINESISNAATAIISEGTCCIRGPQYAFIAIDDYNNSVNNYFISAYQDSISSPNVVVRLNLSQIQQNGQSYQMGQDDGVSSQPDFRSRSYFGPVDIQKMRITVLDEFGRVLNLNNMDWSMAIMFECMYE
jgi:hypothetical protein